MRRIIAEAIVLFAAIDIRDHIAGFLQYLIATKIATRASPKVSSKHIINTHFRSVIMRINTDGTMGRRK